MMHNDRWRNSKHQPQTGGRQKAPLPPPEQKQFIARICIHGSKVEPERMKADSAEDAAWYRFLQMANGATLTEPFIRLQLNTRDAKIDAARAMRKTMRSLLLLAAERE